MAAGKDRKYFLVGGKGGVGKTSCSSSLAVKFATAGHPTLLVSTDPAHSLSDSLAQDVTGGLPVAVDGTDGMLYAMEVDPDQAKEEFAAFARQNDVSSGAKDFMSSVGLGGLADQVAARLSRSEPLLHTSLRCNASRGGAGLKGALLVLRVLCWS